MGTHIINVKSGKTTIEKKINSDAQVFLKKGMPSADHGQTYSFSVGYKER